MRPLFRFLSLTWPAGLLGWLWTRSGAPGSPWANGDLLPMLKTGAALWCAVYWISALPDWWHGVPVAETSGRAAWRATLALLVGAVLFALWVALRTSPKT